MAHFSREEILTSGGLMLDWIRDMRQVDPVADWCWRVLRAVIKMPDGEGEGLM
jgi:hypothetical protein